MDLLRLLCHGSAQLLAKVRLAICLLCAAVLPPGAAHRCCDVWVYYLGIWKSIWSISKRPVCQDNTVLITWLTIFLIYLVSLVEWTVTAEALLPRAACVFNWSVLFVDSCILRFSLRWSYFSHIFWGDKFMIKVSVSVLKGCDFALSYCMFVDTDAHWESAKHVSRGHKSFKGCIVTFICKLWRSRRSKGLPFLKCEAAWGC